MDLEWLSELETSNQYFDRVERYNYELATLSQEALVAEAKEIIGLEKKIEVYSWENLGESHTNFIVLCSIPDLDQRLTTVYHELGHIVHHDSQENVEIENDSHRIQERIESADFSEDLKHIQDYLEKGKLAFDETTHVGKIILETLKTNPPLWLPPKTPEAYKKMFYLRGQEQRADLFLLEQLLKQNKLSSIVRKIDDYGTSNYVTVNGEEDKHPSDLERALYMAGFLLDHHIQLNKFIKESESNGICIDAENLHPDFKHSKNHPGSLDYIAAYWRWKDSQEAYDHWKIEKMKVWNSPESEPDLVKQAQLIEYTQSLLEGLKEASQNTHRNKKLLYSYNFLREIYKAKTVKSIEEISKNWLEEIAYQLWKHQRNAKLLEEEVRTAEERITKILADFEYYFRRSKEEPNLKFLQETAFYAYNYLREMKSLPLAKYFSAIDVNWIASLVKNPSR